ncbi:MAG: DUF72 domain-containing protein [Leptospirales bacterium]|jgi:uncharacterized protein YecE (DUF72 family)
MDFGRVENKAELERIDLSLPQDAPQTKALLARLPPHASGEFPGSEDSPSASRDRQLPPFRPQVYVACPVWNHPGFLDLIYPAEARPREYLRHYARHFNAIELNTTYYGTRPELLRRWRETVPRNFRFVPKLSKVISHDRQLRDSESETLRFCHTIAELGENLGPLFLLLPGGFGPERFDDLARYVERFPRGLELSVELRHPAWFGTNRGEKIWSVFEEHGVSAIITDVAGRRDVLHQRLTSTRGTVVVRFVANGLHPTDYPRLDAWIERLAGWLEGGVRNAYFFLHQPDESQNVELAIYMIERLNRRCGLELRAPKPIARQQELF